MKDTDMVDELLKIDSKLISLDDDDDSDLDDLFIKPVQKKKILVLSDHPLAPSGVGVQARFLIHGLLDTGKYTFRCLGGAIKHHDYRTVKVNDDFLIKPVDGFGTPELIRNLLISEQPDAVLIFTDPRQFIWLWEMEDEIHQMCPITYWHVWDNEPFPEYNRPWYESTDLINCLSYKTYEMVKEKFPEKTEYIPHSFPKNVFFPITEPQLSQLTAQNFGQRADWFKVLWVNRNATRKMPGDLLDAWSLFLKELEEKYGHKKALLIMHTDPGDQEGPNLMAVTEHLGLQDHVWFSTEKLDFDRMNVLHNITDTCINIAKNEGFGLSTLASLQVGRPVIALKTGGETSKVVDSRDGTELGVALEPDKRCLVGSQLVPYIYEDYVCQEQVVAGLRKLYEMNKPEKERLGRKCIDYVTYAFSYEDMIRRWDETLTACLEKWETQPEKRWSLHTIKPTRTSVTQPPNPDSKDKLQAAQIDRDSKVLHNLVANKELPATKVQLRTKKLVPKK